MPFWFNPQPGNPATAVSLTEPQWRSALAQFFGDVDSVEALENSRLDSGWSRTPAGDFWIGTGPGTFLPPATNAANAMDTPTSFEGDTPVGA